MELQELVERIRLWKERNAAAAGGGAAGPASDSGYDDDVQELSPDEEADAGDVPERPVPPELPEEYEEEIDEEVEEDNG